MSASLARVRSRAAVTTGLEVVGFAAVSVGIALISVPCGVIAAGVALVLIGWLAG